MTDTVETVTEENVTESETRVSKPGVMIQMPQEFKTFLEQKAEEVDKTVSGFCRDILADHFNYTLPEVSRGARKKYENDEQRKEAQQKSAQKRSGAVKALVELLRGGGIDLSALNLSEEQLDALGVKKAA